MVVWWLCLPKGCEQLGLLISVSLNTLETVVHSSLITSLLSFVKGSVALGKFLNLLNLNFLIIKMVITSYLIGLLQEVNKVIYVKWPAHT